MTYVPLAASPPLRQSGAGGGGDPESGPLELAPVLVPARPLHLGVDSICREMSDGCPSTPEMLPPEAVHFRHLIHCSHWPATSSTFGQVLGVVSILLAYTTRAVWTWAFLTIFGMDSSMAFSLAAFFYVIVSILAIFYHLRLFREPHVLIRLLRDLDGDGEELKRIEQKAKRGIFFGFFWWAISWCISWWLVLQPAAMRVQGQQEQLLLLLLPFDFVFGRSLEHKAQLLSLYIETVHSLLAKSMRDFAAGFEEVVGSPDGALGPRECYERLHRLECRMRSHVKWVNDMEGAALLAYMVQEGLCAVYTAAVALYTTMMYLEIGLLTYSLVQLCALLRTGLDIARAGDEFHARCVNLDTPRTLYMLQAKLQLAGGGFGAGADYMNHLYRTSPGVRIWNTPVRTPLVVRVCLTLALPTVLSILQSLVQYMNSSFVASAAA